MKKTNKHIFAALAVAAFGLGGMLCSCGGEKKPTGDIIAPKPVAEKKRPVQAMSGYSQRRDIEWLGKRYAVSMSRRADKSLPLTQDEGGNKYYDNQIEVAVSRADGTRFFSKVFRKSDFVSLLSDDFRRNGALLGVTLDKADGDRLLFAASVGSPDMMSDSYVPIVVSLSRTGGLSYNIDNRLDTPAADGGN